MPRISTHRLLFAALALAIASCGQEPPSPTPATTQEAASPSQELIGRSKTPPPPSSLDFRPPADPASFISSARGSLDAVETRTFQILTTEEDNELQSFIAAYRAEGAGTDARLDALIAMADYYSRDIIPVVTEAIEDSDPAVRQAALELLAGSTSSDVLPLAEKALGDSDPLVRSAVASVIARIPDKSVIPLFQKGVADSDDNVPYAFLDAAAHLSRAIQNPVLESALQSKVQDIQRYALAILEQNISSANFDIVLGALDAPDPDLRHEVSFLITNLVDQEFTSAPEARAWWTANRDKYDKDLYPIPDAE